MKTGLLGVDHLGVTGVCPGDDSGSSSKAPPSRTLVCGQRGSKADAPLVKACGGGNQYAGIGACGRSVNGQPALAAPFATAPVVHGRLGKPQVWCPGDVVPALAQAAIRAEAIRLLPHVRIGSAWSTTALVNAEAVLWADTDAHRDLAAAHVLGTDVRVRITFAHASWDFGDGEHDTTADPGKAYDRAHDPCDTKQCAHYYGHTYLHTGHRTMSLTVTWTAEFSLDAGATWTDLAQPITGPTEHRTITVKQTRAVLVPDPGH